MLRIVRLIRNVSLMACLPILCGVLAVLATPASGAAYGRTLSQNEMARAYGGTDFIDKCLGDVPGCSGLDDYYTFYMACFSNFNNPSGCSAAPAAFYNYGNVNTKGCEKARVPATGNVTCIQIDDQEVVCSYFGMCKYTEFMAGDYKMGVCAPDVGTPFFWAPLIAFELIPCNGSMPGM